MVKKILRLDDSMQKRCNLSTLMDNKDPLDPKGVYLVHYTDSQGKDKQYLLTFEEFTEFSEMAKANITYVDGKPVLNTDLQDAFFEPRKDQYKYQPVIDQ